MYMGQTLHHLWLTCSYCTLRISEFEKKQKNKSKDLITAQKIGSIFNFIDDLAAINDGEEFEKA